MCQHVPEVGDGAQVEVLSARILGLLVAVGKHLRAFKRDLPSLVMRVFKLVGGAWMPCSAVHVRSCAKAGPASR